MRKTIIRDFGNESRLAATIVISEGRASPDSSIRMPSKGRIHKNGHLGRKSNETSIKVDV